jgi:two-component system sensor histidine kinase CiaH
MSRPGLFGRFAALATQSAADIGPTRSVGRTVLVPLRRAWRRWFNARDPFAATRWRLLAWNVLVLAIIVVVVGAAVYVTVARTRAAEIDQQLRSVALEQAHRAESHERLEREGYLAEAPGVFLVVGDVEGRIVDDPRAVSVPGFVAASSLATALEGQPNYATVSVRGTPFRVYSTPLTVGGRVVGVIQTGTSLVPWQQELRDLLITMLFGGAAGVALAAVGGLFLVELALVPARRAFARQQQFVADASHELRTPVALIKATTEVIARDPDQPVRASAELLADVQRETDHLGRLIADLLQLARLDSGQLAAELGPVALSDVAREAVEQVKRLDLARDLSLSVVGDPNLWVRGDLGRLRQVLLILLDNAVKHTPPGGQVTVSLQSAHGWGRLAVADTGAGIPAEHLPHIFERFYRVDRARSRAEGGTGLGLAIARELVELQGGRIKVESTPGQGSTFTIWLPATRP